MKDEKDRLGNKLHDVEAAREDQWAAEQDAKLLRRMREKREKSVQCPDCQRDLVPHRLGDVTMLVCPDGDGAWLDKSAFEKLTKSLR